jgi:hypothetical protein
MRTRASLVAIAVAVAAATCSDSPNEPAPVCNITLSPPSLGFGSDAGNGSVTVTAPAGCAWAASANVQWITVTGGASGSGAGTVAYALAANASADGRSGSLTIGGQIHAVNQDGRPQPTCTYTLSPGGAEIRADGDAGAFTVTTSSECGWAATSSDAWVQITSGAQGSGNGRVDFSVSRNPAIPERSTSVTVADRTFSVRQLGDVSQCDYSVAPVDFTPCMAEGTVAATLTTSDACPWTAVPGAAWLDLPSGGAGSGPASINISFSSNYDAPRTGVVMVRWPTATAGQNLRIAQAGCTYGVSQSAFSFGAGAASGTFQVVQQSLPIVCGGATQDACIWTAASTVPWITITTSMPQRGDNPVTFTLAANDGTQPRTGQIQVRDRTITITQAGR